MPPSRSSGNLELQRQQFCSFGVAMCSSARNNAFRFSSSFSSGITCPHKAVDDPTLRGVEAKLVKAQEFGGLTLQL